MIQESEETMSEHKIISQKGRLGRVRFACWGTAFLMIPRLLSSTHPIGIFLLPITFPLYVFAIIKRLRDIGVSPWWALIAWIPLLNLPLLFIAGKSEDNKYGVAPKKYSSSELIFAIFLPIAFIGIIAASTLPKFQENYEHYKQRAEAEQTTPNE